MTEPEAERLDCRAAAGGPFAVSALVEVRAGTTTLSLAGPGGDGAPRADRFRLAGREAGDFLDLFERIAGAFGTRPPRSRAAGEPSRPEEPPYRVLLDENISPDIWYGYGDPAVLHLPEHDGGWRYVTVTSNDAPHSFPLLRSRDFERFEHRGFLFPAGRKPDWALDGVGVADFWAPELHRVGDEIALVYTARDKTGELAIGLAWARDPEGPFTDLGRPLLSGGVIDAHLFAGRGGETILFWKEDSNALWPGRLIALLAERPTLIEPVFPAERDRRTAALMASLKTWLDRLEPMERFMASQTLIEAVIADFPGFRLRLAEAAGPWAEPTLSALRTPVFAQRLDWAGKRLVGERRLVLENTQDWEAHLIEGVWVHEADGRFFLFYAGNDFSTPEYGTGVAVADAPLGPFRKSDRPLLRSSRRWLGPGHPSVSTGPDGRPWLFVHAFRPGEAGYKRFRALLGLPLRFDGDRVGFD